MNKIRRLEDLIVWQENLKLGVMIHRVTKKFPNDELFGIVSQLCRAAYSVSANIAEGFGRRTIQDKRHYYDMAYGSN